MAPSFRDSTTIDHRQQVAFEAGFAVVQLIVILLPQHFESMDETGAPSLKRDRSLEEDDAGSIQPNKQSRSEVESIPPLFLRKVDRTSLSHGMDVLFVYLGPYTHNLLSC